MPLGPFVPQYGLAPTPNGATHLTVNVSALTNYSAPAGAVAFLLQTKDTNAINLRWALGFGASTTIGHQLQPGRDSGLVPFGVTLSVNPETNGTTLEIALTWLTST